MHVVLVYQWFRRSLFLKCESQPKIAQNSQKNYSRGSRLFKVIDVGTPGKLLSNACYNVAASLCLSATVLTSDELIPVKWWFLTGFPSLMPSFEGNLLTQRHETCSQETREYATLSYGKKSGSLSHLGLNRYRQTDGRTDGRTELR